MHVLFYINYNDIYMFSRDISLSFSIYTIQKQSNLIKILAEGKITKAAL